MRVLLDETPMTAKFFNQQLDMLEGGPPSNDLVKIDASTFGGNNQNSRAQSSAMKTSFLETTRQAPDPLGATQTDNWASQFPTQPAPYTTGPPMSKVRGRNVKATERVPNRSTNKAGPPTVQHGHIAILAPSRVMTFL